MTNDDANIGSTYIIKSISLSFTALWSVTSTSAIGSLSNKTCFANIIAIKWEVIEKTKWKDQIKENAMKLNKFGTYAYTLSPAQLLSSLWFHSSYACMLSGRPLTQNLSYFVGGKTIHNLHQWKCRLWQSRFFWRYKRTHIHTQNITHHHAHDIWWNKSNFRHIFFRPATDVVVVIAVLPFC